MLTISPWISVDFTLAINLMLSLLSELALCVSSSCCIDSRPIHVTFDGSPQALIKNERNDDRLEILPFICTLSASPSWARNLGRGKQNDIENYSVPSFGSVRWQAVEFVKAELWCNYWRDKSQKREEQRRWLEWYTDKGEWGFNLQKNETKNICMYIA